MTPCQEWTGTRFSDGYGAVYLNGKTRRVHRVVWEQWFGPIPDGMFVCHHCDNPPCINVDHLFLGTPNDNVQDMIAKGRARYVGAPVKPRCPEGHPRLPRERCRICAAKATERYRARKEPRPLPPPLVADTILDAVAVGRMWRQDERMQEVNRRQAAHFKRERNTAVGQEVPLAIFLGVRAPRREKFREIIRSLWT